MRRHLLLGHLLLAALFLRAFLPTGWMPDAQGALVLCTIDGASVAVHHDAGGKHTPADDAQHHDVCPFSAASMAFKTPDPAIFAAPARIASVLALATPSRAPPLSPRRQPQSPRAPPQTA